MMDLFEQYEKQFNALFKYNSKEESKTDTKESKNANSNICSNCKEERIRDTNSGFLVCQYCGEIPANSSLYCVAEFTPNVLMMEANKYKRSIYFKRLVRKNNILPAHVEELLCRMFPTINDKFKEKVKNRHNFIKYNFVIHKMLESIGKPELARRYPIPTRKRTLRKYNQIWKLIYKAVD